MNIAPYGPRSKVTGTIYEAASLVFHVSLGQGMTDGKVASGAFPEYVFPFAWAHAVPGAGDAEVFLGQEIPFGNGGGNEN